MDLQRIILRLVPNADFSMEGNDFTSIDWRDDRPQPTQSEIDTEITHMESPDFETEQWRKTFKVELYKLKIELDNMGDLDSIESIIATQNKGTQLAWANANTVRRNSPTVAGLATAMGYTPETLDTIFKNANDIIL